MFTIFRILLLTIAQLVQLYEEAVPWLLLDYPCVVCLITLDHVC